MRRFKYIYLPIFNILVNMKDLKIAGLLMVAVTAFISCKKEQALINKIEGTYKIEKLIYITSTGDSVISFSNSTMFFDQCALKKQVAQQCNGYYEISGQKRMSFDYLPRKESGKVIMNINSFDFDATPYFGGSYIIENLTDNSLTLFRQINFNNDKPDVRIFLKK